MGFTTVWTYLDILTCTSMRICINVKVFEWTIMLDKYGYTNHLFRKNGGWRLVLRRFFYKYFSIGFPQFGLGHFNMN